MSLVEVPGRMRLRTRREDDDDGAEDCLLIIQCRFVFEPPPPPPPRCCFITSKPIPIHRLRFSFCFVAISPTDSE